MIYLDANASTVLREPAQSKLAEVLGLCALNPSSAHSAGDVARRLMVEARDIVADTLGAVPEDIIFTSGGTESNNIVISGFARIAGASVFHSAVEHASVVAPAQQAGGVSIPVDVSGKIDLQALEAALSMAGGPSLVCVQAANSETGVIQDFDDVANLVSNARRDAFLMVDAAQAFGRIQIDVEGIDAITFSGHKLHAPVGTGVLYLSERLADVLPGILFGGGQERGVRPGTENVAGIAALGAAVAERYGNFDAHVGHMTALRDTFEAAVLKSVPIARVNGADAARVCNTSNILFRGREALALQARLDSIGVLCSTGSACSNMRPEGSRVLKAMGMSESDASASLRFSFSVDNTEAEAIRAAEAVALAVI